MNKVPLQGVCLDVCVNMSRTQFSQGFYVESTVEIIEQIKTSNYNVLFSGQRISSTILDNSRKSQETPGNSRQFQETPGNSRQLQTTPGSSRQLQATLGISRQHQAIPSSSRQIQASSGNSRRLQETPGNYRKFRKARSRNKVNYGGHIFFRESPRNNH